MTIGRRTDATTATRPEWLPLVQQVASRRSVSDLPKPPPGVDRAHRAYYTTTRTRRNDGTVRVTLKWCEPGCTYTIGAYTDPAGHGNTYPVGKIVSLACGRQVRVALVDGLPWPVPVLP